MEKFPPKKREVVSPEKELQLPLEFQPETPDLPEDTIELPESGTSEEDLLAAAEDDLAAAYDWSQVEANEGLIWNVIRRYYGSYDADTQQELLQQGRIGLAKAWKNADPESKVTFPSYSSQFIKGYMQNWIRDKKDLIKPSMIATYGLELSSLDALSNPSAHDSDTLKETLEDQTEASKDPAISYEKQKRAAELAHIIGLLPEEEARVINLYFGIGEAEYPHRISEIARIEGIYRKTVQARFERGFGKIKIHLKNQAKLESKRKSK